MIVDSTNPLWRKTKLSTACTQIPMECVALGSIFQKRPTIFRRKDNVNVK